MTCLHQRLIEKILGKGQISPKEVEQDISQIPYFNPCSIPKAFPSILLAAIKTDNLSLARFLMGKFPQLLTVEYRGVLPLSKMLKDIMWGLKGRRTENKITLQRIKLLRWCVSSFPEYINLRTKEKNETAFYQMLSDIFERRTSRFTHFQESFLVDLCKIMISGGGEIDPPILPCFLKKQEIGSLWQASELRKVLLDLLPCVLIDIIISYSQIL